MIYSTTLDSPVGTLLLLSNGAEVTGIYLPNPTHGPGDNLAKMNSVSDAEPFAVARRQLIEYFQGERSKFNFPIAPKGTPFQRLVWAELQKIPYGETISYGELAKRLGNPNASRAVGSANGKNPISIVVPCHRVIGTSGNLVGYGGGLATKTYLLNLERRRTQATFAFANDDSAIRSSA